MSTISLNNIFSTDTRTFGQRCLETFRFQYQYNRIYRQWCDALGKNTGNVESVTDIPFLPISFFKTGQVTTTEFTAELVFESSGTTQTVCSRHYVKDAALYRESYTRAFGMFYGPATQYCILALLPSYLEKGNSSLVYMADGLIRQSAHPLSGFYLHDYAGLAERLAQLEQAAVPTILLGVTYALLDFAEAFPQQLKHTIVMETGGMKGRKRELIREEVHRVLQRQFGIQEVHSEYSMTELLSQAYSKGGGRYYCPPWMRVMLRSEEDPLQVMEQGTGIINVVDLANVHSCSFIATDDAGVVHPDQGFEVAGRLDHSDLRGCTLLTL
ncbi:MAG TPA: acyl transferase [Chitinophagaceae bacterium]